MPDEWEEFGSWLVPEAEHQDATQLFNFSSWEVTWPGDTTRTSQGSCGHCLQGRPSCSAGSMHECMMVGLGADTQWFLLTTVIKFGNEFLLQKPPPRC